MKKAYWITGGVLTGLVIGLGALLFLQSSSPSEDIKARAVLMQNYRIYPVPIPHTVLFAGEKVPVSDFEVRERLDRELLINTYWQSSTQIVLKRSKRAFAVIEPILKANGIPDDFKYLAVVESGLADVVSGSGAAGYWQFMKNTGASYGLEISDNADERYHLEKATLAACKYLKHSKELLGSWAMAAGSYNRGLQGVLNAKNAQKQTDYYNLYLNSETSRYVLRMVAMKLIFENPRHYGFQIKPSDYYGLIETYSVKVESNISSLPEWAIEHQTTYKIIRELNPWLQGYDIKASSMQSYIIKVPTLLAQGSEN
jgi:membrane-bound lytic murein transglycosylase D